MIDTTFLSQLNRFSLIVRKRITSSFAGSQKSTSYGTGTVFKDLREYVSGDDIRLIDWNVYARTDKLHVKRYEEDKNLHVHIIVDFSKSMNFGTKVSKFHYASMLGIGFAYLAMRNNQQFEFSTFSDDLNYFRPRKGMNQLASMVDYLNDLKTTGKSNFDEVMAKYRKAISSKSLVVVISDFLFDFDEIRNGLCRVEGNDVKVIMVLDRSEKELTLGGDTKLHDSESDSIIHTFISNRLKTKYQQELDRHTAKIQHACDEMSAMFYVATTDTPVFNIFYEILSQR